MSKILFVCIFAIVALLVFVFFAEAQSATTRPAGETVTVKTPLGDVIGLSNHYNGYKFLGVRFAAPPIGKLRFRDAEEIQPWSQPQNATYNKEGCIQDCKGGKLVSLMCPTNFSEDCLYLNIFTPTLNPDAKLPVMLFLHGGMYEWGSAEIPLYDGSEWGARNNMIVVTANYRLNSFSGIASHHIRGNFGTTDQIQALKFIQKVIGSFGGHKDRVTISGQSSGATSVGVLMTAPSAWPYFSAAVLLSDPIGFTLASKKMAIELGELSILKLGCPIGESANGTEQLECLQSKSSEEILKASKTSYLPTPHEVLSVILPWQPYADGELVPGDPIQMIEQGKYHMVPVYISNVANETAIFVNSLHIDVQTWLLDIAADYIYGIADGEKVAELYGEIPKNYPGGGMMYFSRILTDYTFYCPATHIADIISKHNPVYFAFYDDIPAWTKWYINNTNDNCETYEVCHAFDLVNYFYNPYILKDLPSGFPQLQPDVVGLAHFMQNSVGTFVTSGNVKTPGFAPYNSTTRRMYNYSLPMPTKPLNNYRQKFCDFWNKIGYNRH